VHLVEDVLLRSGVGDSLSEWLDSGAEVVAALLVDHVSNVLRSDLLSCLVSGIAVTGEMPHPPCHEGSVEVESSSADHLLETSALYALWVVSELSERVSSVVVASLFVES
jgi:hypothetical protein